MSLRSPAEYYLKYLIVHPDKYPDKVIKDTLMERGIFYLGDDYVQKLRIGLVVPEVFRPFNEKHAPTRLFLIREKLRTLFQPTRDTKITWKILEHARAREFVETMLLAHAPAAAIAARVTAQSLFCTAEAVEEYKKYFWNLELLDATQMRTLLQMTLDQNVSDSDPATEKDRKRALKKAGYQDPRKLASEMPYSPLTALMAQMRMGMMPSRFELATIMQTTQAMAVLKTLEATMFGGPRDSQTALNFSSVARNMTESLETVVRPDEHLREQLQAIALRTETAPVPSIHQLSAGNHTVDMQPQNLQVPQHEPGIDEGGDGDSGDEDFGGGDGHPDSGD